MIIQLNQAYSFSQPGMRPNQEDSRCPNCDVPSSAQRFFVVCDGVGGQAKGEVASATVCRYFENALASYDFSKPFGEHEFNQVLAGAFNALAQVSSPSNQGMATTLTFAAFHVGGCFLAHIGDSRIYYVRPGLGIVYRSEDHSLVNALVKAGVITKEEAETHPDRNVITRSICVPEPDQQPSEATSVNVADVRQGDYVFLCSDGVLKCVSDDMIVQILSSQASDAEKCAQIAALCVTSDDNNTAYLVSVASVVADVPETTVEISAPIAAPDTTTRVVNFADRKKSVKATTSNAEKQKKGILLTIIVAVVAVVAIAALLWWGLGSGAEKSESANVSEKVEMAKSPEDNEAVSRSVPSEKDDDDDEVSEKRESPKQKDKPTSKPQSDNAASQAEAKDKADAVANQASERSSNSKREAAESKEKQSKPEIITNPDASGGIEI